MFDERLLAELYANVPDAVLFVRLSDRAIVACNPATEIVFGYLRTELIGRCARTLHVDDEHYKRFSLLTLDKLKHGGSFRGEFEMRRRDGGVFPAEHMVTIVRTRDGSEYMIALVRDISVRKSFEHKLRDTERAHREILLQAAEGIYRAAPSGELVMVNPAMARLFGFETVEDFHARGPRTVGELSVSRDIYELLARAWAEGEVRDVVARGRRRDGSTFWLTQSLRPILGEGGECLGYTGFLMDVTARQKAEFALRERIKERDCLYRVGRMCNDAALGIQEVFAHVVEILPSGWQYPDICRARIVFDEGVFASPGFEPSPHSLRAAIVVNGVARGMVEVVYLAARVPDDEDPFLVDERELLESIARDLAMMAGRKESEAALALSEERFRDFAGVASDWLWELDADLRFTYLSGRYESALGVPTDAALGATPWEFAGADANEEPWREHVATLLARRAFKDFEITDVGQDGETRYLAASGRPLFSSDGRFRGYRGTTRDITEAKRARHALEESEARLRLLMRNLPGLVFQRLMYPDGTITHPFCVGQLLADEKAAQIDEAGGWRLEALMDEEGRARFHEAVLDSARTMESMDFTMKLTSADGAPYWLRSISTPRRLDDGTILWEGVAIDVTSEKKMERELRAQQSITHQRQKLEALGTLASGIAHDFNNLLLPIILRSEFVLEDLPPDSPLREDVETILESSLQARDLIGKMLTYARETPSEPRNLDIAATVNELLPFLRRAIPASVEVVPEVGENAGMVLADPTDIHQVLLNLASNAVDAMDGTGTLRIMVRAEALEQPRTSPHFSLAPGSYVRLSVSDSGCGIDPATMERIFDPFYTTKDVGRGTGLGLAVVHGIATRHRGAVFVTSHPGDGTTFEVLLPRVSADPTLSGR